MDKEKQLKHALAINQMIGNVYTEEDVELSLNEYLKLLNQRRETLKQSQGHWYGSLSVVPGMSMDNDHIWGSKRQYLYGSIVSEIFGDKDIKIVPFMCVALNPTGGICGSGNNVLYNGSLDSVLTIHSCIHDASGYCYTYHGIGHGYNYLNTWLALPTGFALSCQLMGLLWCVYCKM